MQLIALPFDGKRSNVARAWPEVLQEPARLFIQPVLPAVREAAPASLEIGFAACPTGEESLGELLG